MYDVLIGGLLTYSVSTTSDEISDRVEIII